VYSRETIYQRVENFYHHFLSKEKRLWVTSFEGACVLHDKANVACGQWTISNHLKGRKVLSLGSAFHVEDPWLDQLVGPFLTKREVSLLINGTEDRLDPYLLKKILREYCEDLLWQGEIVFLANSNLHLMKDLFQTQFPDQKVLSYIDILLMDYFVERERKRDSIFYVTGSRREFYLPAEDYLQPKKYLKVWRIKDF
ncbi:MAG: hypothetical protein Q4P25_02285, partial [Tissierellia bacterium]|nr:hypothetical protein [Tissierellia bacterium]